MRTCSLAAALLYLLFVNLVSHLALGLLGYGCPFTGVVDHSAGVQQSVAKPVADVPTDSIRHPVFVTEVLLLGSEHYNMLHITPGEARTKSGKCGRGEREFIT